MKLNTSQIIFREDLYPRFRPDPATIQNYSENLDQLPPIEVNQHHELIDGYHRWKAYETEGVDEIEIQVSETKSEMEFLQLAIDRNAKHGRQLTVEEKKELAKRLYPKLSIPQLAKLLAVSERVMSEKYLASTLAKLTKRRNERIIDLRYENGRRPQEEIAEQVSQELGIPCSQPTVARVLKYADGLGDLKRGREVEHLVNESLGATKPKVDQGVDGITPDGRAIQTTMTYAVDRPKLDQLVAGMRRRNIKHGILVGKRITLGATQEMDRLAREEDIQVEFQSLTAMIDPLDRPEKLFKSHQRWVLNNFLPLKEEAQDYFSEEELPFWLEEVHEMRESDSPFLGDFDRRIYTVWNFHKANNQVRHFGNIPPEIIDNLLFLYTKPFDVVFDPFGGGGSTIDQCLQRKRRYYVSDLNPIPARSDIRQHDITQGLPADLPVPDFVFLDPPYWRQAEGKYSRDETGVDGTILSQRGTTGNAHDVALLASTVGALTCTEDAIAAQPISIKWNPFSCFLVKKCGHDDMDIIIYDRLLLHSFSTLLSTVQLQFDCWRKTGK